jgi:3-hydroxyacyl-[acyl-carrier-protein] dehydratase
MRFHLIDRIESFETGRSVRASKLTSWSEEYWEDAADGAVMPPVLVLEALCQAGSWLIVLSTDGRKRAALASIGSSSFEGPVRPGDVLRLDGKVDSMTDEAAVLSGSVSVDGRVVLRATEIMCVLIDAGRLAGPEETLRMSDQLTRQRSD